MMLDLITGLYWLSPMHGLTRECQVTVPSCPHTVMHVRQPPGGADEDDGYVLVAVHNAATGKGDLAILDAKCLSKGPVATIHLPHFLPAGLHGSFSTEVFHESSPAGPKWVEPNHIRQI